MSDWLARVERHNQITEEAHRNMLRDVQQAHQEINEEY